MLDALHRLADEGLDQEPLGILGWNAARPEIEQQVFVESAGGGAVAALDVIGRLPVVHRIANVIRVEGDSR